MSHSDQRCIPMVTLRHFRMDDAADMALYANNPKIAVNLRDGFPYPYSPEHAAQFLKMVMERDPQTFFAIEADGQYVGNISLSPGTDVYRKSAELGYLLFEPWWNKGIMTEAVRLMADYGFQKLELMRIYACIYDYNAASQRVLEKCGFVREGISRSAVFKNGAYHDEIRYALLKDG